MHQGRVLLRPKSNHAGGTLGGLSMGADLVFRVAIKPVSTIGQPQSTVDFGGESVVLEAKGRHDPCVLPRTPPLIEAMTALVLIDAALIQRARGPLYLLPSEEAEHSESRKRDRERGEEGEAGGEGGEDGVKRPRA